MSQAFDWITANLPWLVAALGLTQLLLFIILIIIIRRLARGLKPYCNMVKGLKEQPVEILLHDYMAKVGDVLTRVKDVEVTCKKMEQRLDKALQRVGLVRYNAFSGVGSDQSFSVALLDRQGDGVVITGIYGRDESRPYAKPIRQGRSSYPLSEEEEEAISQALS